MVVHKSRERGGHMKGRKQVLTWTFLSVFLLAQTTIFLYTGQCGTAERAGKRRRRIGTTDETCRTCSGTSRCKTSPLRSEKRESYVLGQQAVWQQAGGRKKPEEVCSYSKQNCGWIRPRETSTIRSAFKSAAFFLQHSEKGRA